jgi:hypothetical protein
MAKAATRGSGSTPSSREARVIAFDDTLAGSSPVQEIHERVLRASLVWAGQGIEPATLGLREP